MNKTIYHVDAFTNEAFKGNPAGVYITREFIDESMMQNIAAELNLSETAFITPESGKYRIRFYTPECEVDLCGHATLSAAHILYETGIVTDGNTLVFNSKAGELKISKSNNLITLNFPVYSLK